MIGGLVRLVVVPRPPPADDVATEEPVLVVDAARRLPGRGVNVHARPRCLDRALAPRALARALRVATAPATAAVRGQLLRDSLPVASDPSTTTADPPSGSPDARGLRRAGDVVARSVSDWRGRGTAPDHPGRKQVDVMDLR